jgi:hypothetical protein
MYSTQVISTTAGICIAATPIMAQVPIEGAWLELAMKASMTFVFAIFLLRTVPQLHRIIEEQQKAYLESLEKLIATNAKKDAAWQSIVTRRGNCPIHQHKIEDDQSEP